MKKTILSLMLVLAFLPVMAQNHIDTIFTYFDHYQGRRDPTFYYYGGFDDWFRISRAAYGNTEGKKLQAGPKATYRQPIFATYRYIDTTLRIIGVAAPIEIYLDNRNFYRDYADTTIAGREPEYLQLYKPTDDSLILLAEGCWNDVQPRYRLQIYTSDPPMLYYPYIYEVYFDSAVTVSDSFYVAGTELNNHDDTVDHDKYAHPQTRLWQIAYEDSGGPYTSSRVLRRELWPEDNGFVGLRGELTLPHRGTGLLIFPIFDTTGIVLDVTQPTRLAEQHTTLYPNPAITEASLFSSFRIHTVEVYNAQGQLVEQRKVEAQYARLNLAAYPKGMYVVVVTTAAGRTTKKLLVE